MHPRTERNHRNGFSLLTGADANGNTNPATSCLTQYFSGAGDSPKGGRMAGITWISDIDTGQMTDLNLAFQCYTGMIT